MNSATRRAGLLAGLLLIGCDRKTETIQPIALKGTVVSDGEFLAKPTRILPLGDRLVVVDEFEPHLHVLDPTSGNLLTSWGKSGGGPGEFDWAREILEAPSRDGTFWIYDSAQRRFTHIGLDAGRVEPRVMDIVRIASLPPLTLLMEAVLLDDSTLAASGIISKGRLVRARLTGEQFTTLGKTPSPLTGQNVPITVLQHAWEGPIERSPDASRLALATRNADLIEIYRPDGTLLHSVRGGEGFDPVYSVRQTQAGVGMATGMDLRFGYTDLASTSEYLFGLFSGETRGAMPGRAQYGKTVHVFDWEGERVATLDLPERARAIAVTPDGAELLAIHLEPKPAVYRYPIREHLPGRR